MGLGTSSEESQMRSAFLQALLDAKLAGFYIPEIEDVYFRHENFQTPHVFPNDFGY
jgi:hypothetical protein